MGGWIALLLAEALRDSGRIAGLVLIAPAVDMTRALMWDRWKKKARDTLMTTGDYREPSEYSDAPYPITRALIEDGDSHLFGDRLIDVGCPVHILQGVADKEVPWRHAARLVDAPRLRRCRADAGQGRRPPPVAAGGHRAAERCDRSARR